MDICAVIFVGGPSKATRLRPLSLETPKALFPCAGISVVEHQIKSLLKIENLKNIFIVGNYKQFSCDFSQNLTLNSDIKISYFDEGVLKGTGSALLFLHKQNIFNKFSHLIICHCDVVCDFPFKSMYEYILKHDKYSVILSTKIPKDISFHFGCLISDNDDKVVHYVEKPESFSSDTVYAGIAILHCNVLEKLQEIQSNASEFIDLGCDLFPILVENKLLLSFNLIGHWCSVKSPNSVLYANSLLLKENYSFNSNNNTNWNFKVLGNVFIHPTAVIHQTATIGKNVSIGPNCVIEKGVRILESVLMNNVIVKENSFIKDSIICSQCTIGSWCRVEGRQYEDFFEYYRKIRHHNSYFTIDGKKLLTATVLGPCVCVKVMTSVYNSIIMPNKDISFDCISEIII